MYLGPRMACSEGFLVSHKGGVHPVEELVKLFDVEDEGKSFFSAIPYFFQLMRECMMCK